MFLGVPFSTRIRAACLTAISTLVLLLTIRRFAIFDNILVTTVTTCNSFTNHPLAYQSSMCHYRCMIRPNTVTLWETIKTWYAEHLPEVLGSLNPGVSESALAELEDELGREVGQRLPQSLRDIYLQNNGQQSGATGGMFFGLEFLSLEGVVTNWRDWKNIAGDSLYDNLSENSVSHPPEAIRAAYANAGWIPFAYDWSSNHIGIDLSPGPVGQVGQIINFGSDEDNKFVIAPSFETFLVWHLEQLRKGNFRIVTETSDGTEGRYINLGSPYNTHLLDAIPKLFGPK